MRKLAKLVIPSSNSPIELPEVVRNYELKGVYFNQLPSYHGLPNEDPLTFMCTFYCTVENFLRNSLTNEQLRLRCFPYTLKDRANAWWLSIPAGSLTTWDQIYERFVGKFYSHSKTMSLSSRYVPLRKVRINHSMKRGSVSSSFWDNFLITITLESCSTSFSMMV